MVLRALEVVVFIATIVATIALLAHPPAVGRPLENSSSAMTLPYPGAFAVEEVAAKVLPSVVTLQFNDGSRSQLGSGVLLTADGLIITNNHVTAPISGGRRAPANTVVTLNDGKPGERSISVACMHCSDAPCIAVCPVDCIYDTEEGVVLHSKDLCIGCGYCFYACPFGAPQYPQAGNFGSRGKMDKCTFCNGGPEEDHSSAEFQKYGRNRLAEGKLPLCAEMCSTKALLAGDGDQVSDIYRQRIVARGFGTGAWGWGTAYERKGS